MPDLTPACSSSHARPHPRLLLSSCPSSPPLAPHARPQPLLQILSVLNAICDDQGAPLVSAARLSTSTLPARTPDVVVTTPAALQAVWTEISPGYSRGWLARGSLLRGIRVVVMDEADLVLTGAGVVEGALRAGR